MGIATTLSLKPDQQFVLTQHHLGKADGITRSSGTFQWTTNDQLELRFAEAQNDRPTSYLLNDDKLRQLDLAELEITGALAERYVLQLIDLPSSDNQREYWINTAKVDCHGAGTQQCLQVARSGDQGHSEWQLFYSEIEGFNFQPGMLTHLLVEVTPVEGRVPADASSLRYRMVKELARYPMPQAQAELHDIWVLRSLAGQSVPSLPGLTLPRLELNLTTMRALGTDGCNNFKAPIETAGMSRLSFGPLMSTRKFCREEMERAKAFNDALEATAAYRVTGIQLTLLDSAKQELMVLRHVD